MSRNDRVRVSVSGLAYTGAPEIAEDIVESITDAYARASTPIPPIVERFLHDMQAELDRLEERAS